MRQVACAIVYLIAASSFASCQDPEDTPADFLASTLNPEHAVKDASLIVLGFPVSHRDVTGILYFRQQTGRPALRVVQTETTLTVVRFFKGSMAATELRFRHYDARGYILSGPPQGPSGSLGAMGIFFLKHGQNGSLRSLVDVYRPDIPTPWVTRGSNGLNCVDPGDCIGKFLLTFHNGDKHGPFSTSLMINSPISQSLIGYLNTFQLLRNLSASTTSSEVRRYACTILARMYALEFPSSCKPLIANTPLETEHLNHVAELRNRLREGGSEWLRDQLRDHHGNDSDIQEDLQLITRGADLQARDLAGTILRTFK